LDTVTASTLKPIKSPVPAILARSSNVDNCPLGLFGDARTRCACYGDQKPQLVGADNTLYENAFNKIERDLRAEEGIANELDYVEQTSWVLFLKYLHDLEAERSDRAELDGEDYTPIIDGEFRWDKWAAPKKDGEFDHNTARIGDDLIKFVDQDLFPYLASFRQSATSPQTIQYKIGEVFTELRNKFRSGYILRDVLEQIDGLSFGTQEERHELSSLYETRIKRMGNAGRNGGEYYTPRPLIRAMIKVTAPKIGETIYDGACGSGGFLCEAYDYLRTDTLSASEYETLQTKTFYGQEKKGLAYIIGIMNMVLHGIEAPNLIHSNTLNENVMDIQEKDRHDIILANPPFGGGERREVQQNFPIRTGETAYLFLQHFIRKLKAGGRVAVVIKNTFLSNTDNASIALRKELLEAAELHTILDCPQGTFQGAGVKTVVLFFEKGAPTRDIWYYQLDPGRSLGKTNPLNDDDLAEFVELQRTRPNGPKSWIVNRANLDEDTYDLSVKNPNAPEAEPLRSPEEIIGDMLARDAETAQILEDIRGML
jgi:type I restriction enzyme M protein